MRDRAEHVYKTKSASPSQTVDSHREVPATTTMARAVSTTVAAMVATRTLVAISAVNLTGSMVMINVTIVISRVHLSVREKVQAKEINDQLTASASPCS